MFSLFSWIFLRNGPGAGLVHQAHAYLLLSTLTFYVIFYYCVNTSDKKVFFTLFVLSILFNINQNIFDPIALRHSQIIISPTAYIYNKDELNNLKLDQDNFYLSNSENIAKSQMKASLAGARYSLKNRKMPVKSHLNMMLVEKTK